jgi:endoglucanase
MMRKLMCILLSCIILCTSSRAQDYLRADGKQIKAGNKEILLRGIGLGGWMLQEPYMLDLSGTAIAQFDIRNKITALIGKEKTQQFYDTWLANHCRRSDIDSLAAWGFNSIRLPMHYNLFTLPVEEEPVAGKNTWLSKGFALTDSLVKWCSARKIYVILDLHAAPGGQGNDQPISDRNKAYPSLWESKANQQKTLALWQRIAKHYANEPWIGGYDLLNETNWGFEHTDDKNGCNEKANKELKAFLMEITAAVRKVDSRHALFIEGNCWANNYNGMFPLWDNNMIISFHKYWNRNDQGSVQHFVDLRERYNVPVWMGESGENSNEWFTDAISLMEKNNIGWAWWPLKKNGMNNPMQVHPGKGYEQIIAYWKGKAEQPSATEAYKSLMQLTEALKTENCTLHKDVIRAMFGQVGNTATMPFKTHAISSGNIVYATDYDMGRSGYAYSDTADANYRVATGNNIDWNSGWAYRNDGVDIEACSDALSNGYNVGWITDGEWMQYTLNGTADKAYTVNLRVASPSGAGTIQLIVNDVPVQQMLQVPNTGGNQQWTTLSLPGVLFKKGTNTLKVKAVKGGFNLNYLQFVQAGELTKNN